MVCTIRTPWCFRSFSSIGKSVDACCVQGSSALTAASQVSSTHAARSRMCFRFQLQSVLLRRNSLEHFWMLCGVIGSRYVRERYLDTAIPMLITIDPFLENETAITALAGGEFDNSTGRLTFHGPLQPPGSRTVYPCSRVGGSLLL